MALKPSELLDSAADIILRDGWNQGSYFDTGDATHIEEEPHRNKTAPCCQAGALSRAAWGYAWVPSASDDAYAEVIDYTDYYPKRAAVNSAEEYMNRYLTRLLGTPSRPGPRVPISAIAWNDEPNRTAEEVVAALRGAAEMARAAGE